MANPSPDWPELPLDVWKPTYDTLHMYTQIIGKLRLALSPMTNQWWQVPLYVSARGLTSSPIPYQRRIFEAEFDFFDHQLVIRTSDGQIRRIALGAAVKDFYREVMATLAELGIEVQIYATPVEVLDPIPFPEDDRHATYVPDEAQRFWCVLVQADTVFKQFRARFRGKCSPINFYWGSFDLAVSRFSGRDAPPREGADRINRLAYDQEVISLGFWPGGATAFTPALSGAAFYSYTYPRPEGWEDAQVRPAAGHFNRQLMEFMLMYDDVRTAPNPEQDVLEFAQSTYEAGAELAHWDRRALEMAAVPV